MLVMCVWCKKNKLVCVAVVLAVLWYFGYWMVFLKSVGLSEVSPSDAAVGVRPCLRRRIERGSDGGQGMQNALDLPVADFKARDLGQRIGPRPQSLRVVVTADGLKNVNLLKAGAHIGVDTVGQSLRNASRQLRSGPRIAN